MAVLRRATAAFLVLLTPAALDRPASGADPEAPLEYEVKAAFIYNFARFVEWPERAFESPEAPIVVGVLGHDPFGGALERTLAGKTVNGRAFTVHRYGSLHDLEPCTILFLGGAGPRNLQAALTILRQSPVLTVGESDRFARLGGIVNFFVEDRRVRFVINVDAAERAGLKLSSRLLELARVVHESSGPEERQ